MLLHPSLLGSLRTCSRGRGVSGTSTQQVQNNIGPMNWWLLVKQQVVMPPVFVILLCKIKLTGECAGFFGSICTVRKLSFCKNMCSFFPCLNIILFRLFVFSSKTNVPHSHFRSLSLTLKSLTLGRMMPVALTKGSIYTDQHLLWV